jgi:hypothetical protein
LAAAPFQIDNASTEITSRLEHPPPAQTSDYYLKPEAIITFRCWRTHINSIIRLCELSGLKLNGFFSHS